MFVFGKSCELFAFMILLIDNYDSFTYNIVHCLEEVGARVRVVLNDEINTSDIVKLKPKALVLSPGPGTPDEAGITLGAIQSFANTLPILGICLGHQAIGQSFGGVVTRAPELMHGKTSEIHHDGSGIFKGVPSPFSAVRYHSLAIDPKRRPKGLRVTARTSDGVIMGIEHVSLPVFGVQFHPESWLSRFGHRLLRNFLTLAKN